MIVSLIRAPKGIAIALLPVLLAGCASLPTSGPTAHDIVRAQHRLGGFDIVNVDEAVIEEIGASPSTGRGRLAALALPGEVDRIGPGDILQVSVFEVGSALFGGRSVLADPTATASGSGETLPPVVVGKDGTVTLPWVGRRQAAGLTPDELGAVLTQAYRANSENPQVMVSIRDNVNNTVFVQGEVRKPGRMPLTLARERVLDAIAVAGGAANPSGDSLVRLSRGTASAEQPLSAIDPGSADDLELLPQDRISVAFRPRTYVMLGAAGNPAEVPFQNLRVSLAEALGRAAGPHENQADPAAVFVFRYEQAELDGSPVEGAKPVAYRIDMRDPRSYFLTQRFEMRPRDVVYVANAGANIPQKAIQILNLFFSPFYTARVLTR
ncbi:polysaccharide export protein [Sphingomonas sp. H39-1-10]|uniref:polysaccharide biosynthesis/export family protein n=1 Tax=Sphingomonas pollutisoli TaxID=3030829 RepID=UPI0023B8B0E9|nr:polysaccharide biosynthesis/export family protein [Sphingomonas pollutisoli]MDF0490491.1 polysaccharide export protein [Sphingomonas pollutisoli]